eukprot:TRINITY_DN26369_c0_g1_i1.p1 TRINITY_DN26369_c0_g1~~TRINITY_DN26369_c0_g1_i1.p1  ORF type:complete len:536 (-),score=136.44 TRINITY_DN26369_c0_g1_i1:153-1760(-)
MPSSSTTKRRFDTPCTGIHSSRRRDIPWEVEAQQINALQANRKREMEAMFQKMGMSSQTMTADDKALKSRVFVGNVDSSVSENDLKILFERFGPLNSVCVPLEPSGKHKGFAFIEYTEPDNAKIALDALVRKEFNGRRIKLGRPTNPIVNDVLNPMMMHDAGGMVRDAAAAALSKAGIQLSQSAKVEGEEFMSILAEGDRPTNIFVGNVHPGLKEDDIQTVFESFGEISSLHLVPKEDRPDSHKGYGFIVYKDAECATEAVSTMDNFALGDRPLRVGWAKLSSFSLLPASIMPTAEGIANALKPVKIVDEDDQFKPLPFKRIQGNRGGRGSERSRDDRDDHRDRDRERADRDYERRDRRERERERRERDYRRDRDRDEPEGEERSERVHRERSGAADLGERAVAQANMAAGDSLDLEENMTIRGGQARLALMKRLQRSDELDGPSPVILLTNMVTHDEVDEHLEGEVFEECSKYGKVVRCQVYLADDEVRIFAHFVKPESAVDAANALDNRFFGGRVIKAISYPYEAFINKDFTK